MKPYYERAGIQLFHADCLELLPTLEAGSVDCVVTDPPYGDLATHGKHLSTITLRNGESARQILGFDGITIGQCVELAATWIQIARRWVVFTCEWKYAHALDAAGLMVRLGIWRKPDGAPQFTGDRPGMGWEAVAICHRPGRKHWNGGGKHAFWTFPKGQNDSGHPTGKPIGLFSAFVADFSNVGDTILDPFAGSCTTLLAAWQLGRKAIGVEISEEYCELGAKRLDQEISRGRLFEPEPEPQAEQLEFTE